MNKNSVIVYKQHYVSPVMVNAMQNVYNKDHNHDCAIVLLIHKLIRTDRKTDTRTNTQTLVYYEGEREKGKRIIL